MSTSTRVTMVPPRTDRAHSSLWMTVWQARYMGRDNALRCPCGRVGVPARIHRASLLRQESPPSGLGVPPQGSASLLGGRSLT